ncbi:MAG: hypothetical protein OES09_05430 [Gammaproteobacteria bacterium]|nr:hypothetical protein [Gammaproteobacteria bacterium]
MTEFSGLSRDSLKQRALRSFRRGHGSRPDVRLVSIGDDQVVLKDHNGCDRWFGLLIGPLLVWREARALRRLDSVTGTPRVLVRLDRRALLLEYLPGTPITKADVHAWEPFFARLEALVEEMHRVGVAHCDLRSPTNTLIGPDGEPYLVDFVASVTKASGWNPVGRWIFSRFRVADREAVVKLKSIVAPELLSSGERQILARRMGPVECAARWLGSSVRDLSRKLFTGTSK